MPFSHSKYKTSEITLTTWPSICEWRRHKKGCFWFQWRTLCSDDVTKPRKLDVEQASGTRLTGFPSVSNCVHLLNRNKSQQVVFTFTMVEFNFNISSLFPEDISIISNDLIPLGYSGEDNYALLKKKVCSKIFFYSMYFNSMSPHLKLTISQKNFIGWDVVHR